MSTETYRRIPVAITAARRKTRESMSEKLKHQKFCVVQLPHGLLSVMETNRAVLMKKSIVHSVGVNDQSALPEVR